MERKGRRAGRKTYSNLREQVLLPALFPTPRSGKTTNENEESWMRRQAQGKVATPPLSLAAKLWPTPQADDVDNVNPNQKRRNTLVKEVNARIWPTPTSREWKGARMPETLAAAGRNETNSLGDAVAHAHGLTNPAGSLNPAWVEFLMGYPTGWTDLEASVTPSCPS